MKTSPITPALRAAMKRFDDAYADVKRQFELLESTDSYDLAHAPVNAQLVELNDSVEVTARIREEMAKLDQPIEPRLKGQMPRNEALAQMNSEVEQQAKELQWRLDYAIEHGYTTREESDFWTIFTIRDKVDKWEIPMPPTDVRRLSTPPRPMSELEARIAIALVDGLIEPGALDGINEEEAMSALDNFRVPRNSQKWYTLKERLDVAVQIGVMSEDSATLLYQGIADHSTPEHKLVEHLDALNVPTAQPQSQFAIVRNEYNESVFFTCTGTLRKPNVGFNDIDAVVQAEGFPIASASLTIYKPIQAAPVWHALANNEIQATVKSLLINGQGFTVYQSNDTAKIMELLTRK